LVVDDPQTELACKLNGLVAVAGELNSVVRELRGDLDKIVVMAMRPETDRRYSSVEQFADDIRRYLNRLPVLAQEDSVGYRVSKYVKRNKPGVAAGLGITASLVGGLIVARRQARIASRQRDRAERANLFLQKMLASADPRKSGKDLRAVEMLKLAGETIGAEFGAQPEIASNLNGTLGLTYLSLGRIEDAGAHLRSALEIRLAHFPRTSIAVARSLNDYGKFLHAKGDLSGAEPYYRNALRIFERDGQWNLDLADVLGNLGYLAALMGNNETRYRASRARAGDQTKFAWRGSCGRRSSDEQAGECPVVDGASRCS
jgi:serine/threonine-protein kinase